MFWTLRSTGVESDAFLREHIERRLNYALSRFGARVNRVTVYLSDRNGPKGGIDKSCRIVVRLRGLGEIVSAVDDTDWTVAVDRAATRAGHTVSRALERKRDIRHEAYAESSVT
jgi:putative sigma-54 modulation protein